MFEGLPCMANLARGFGERKLWQYVEKALFVSVEFPSYLNYCRSLRFEERPDYSFLRQTFRTLFHHQGFTYDYVFDWNLLKFVSIVDQRTRLSSRLTRSFHNPGTNKASKLHAKIRLKMVTFLLFFFLNSDYGANFRQPLFRRSNYKHNCQLGQLFENSSAF